MEISDYISIVDYVERMKKIDNFGIEHWVSNAILWNSRKQKVNKGTYYVISIGNRLYNILFNDEKIMIDERTKIEFDEQTQKEKITEEKVITFDINTNEYHYFGAKHDITGDTFYTRYYDKNRLFSMGTLDLSSQETYDEISLVISNIENIEGFDSIFDINLLKRYILDDLGKNYHHRKL